MKHPCLLDSALLTLTIHGMRAQDLAVVSSLLRMLSVPVGALSLLLAHAAAVRDEGDRLGLVAVADLDSVVRRHTGDSLLFALVRRPMPGESWVDVGSGAGFPGMVLACGFPDTEFTLVEPQRRRAGFLDLQCARLGLANAHVASTRAELVEPRFDVAVARALAEPHVAISTLLRLAPHGTAVLAVGGAAETLEGIEDVQVSHPGVDSPGRFFVGIGKDAG